MAKEIAALIKLQIKGGAANPSPPVGPALGSKGVNIMDFCKQFNALTQNRAGKTLPVIITVYTDKSFTFVVKEPPVAVMIKEAAKYGVCKVNIDTDVRLAMTAEIRKYLTEHPEDFDPRLYLGPARAAITEMVRHKIRDVLNSSGTMAL